MSLGQCGWWGGSAAACAVVLFSYWCRKSQQLSSSTESAGWGKLLPLSRLGVQDWVLFKGVPYSLQDLKFQG